MAMMDGNDPRAGGGGGTDWWSENAPPPPTAQSGPITDPNDPRLSDPAYATDPNVLSWLNQRYGAGGTALNQPTPTTTWDPNQQGWNPAPTPTETVKTTQNPVNPVAPGAVPQGVPTSGFGAAPTPYASDPNAPQYEPLPTYVPPTWTGGDFQNPTEQDLYNSPGYQARLDQRLKGQARQFASQGTVLNGGTLKALDRSAQDYATGEYQTLRNNSFEAYKQRYSQFTDAAGMDLGARTLNANQNQNTFANRTATYNQGNARTLSDYITNVTNNRNAELDYWNRLNDVNNTGANLAGGSYRV